MNELGTATLLVGGYLFLLGSSGVVVNLVLEYIDEPKEADTSSGVDESEKSPTQTERDIGVVIGKCENVLVLTFVLLGAYTGLAIIFAAKGIVRSEDIRNNTRYYLAGTLANFTYSILIAAFLIAVLSLPVPTFALGLDVRTWLGVLLVVLSVVVFVGSGRSELSR